MKSASVIFVSLAILYASASDSAVPEDSLFALDDDLSEARETLNQMKTAGKSEAACRKLVKDTKDEITENVKNSQKALNELEKGKTCEKFHKETADEKLEAKKTAENLTKKISEKKKASDFKVVFGSRTFSSLKEGDCATFFTHGSYVSAKAAYEKASKEVTEAQGAKKTADEVLKKAIEQANEDTQKCLCTLKTLHKTSYESSRKNDAANEKAWNMAHKLECVLDGKTSCQIPPVPVTKVPSVETSVKEVSCTASKKVDPKPPADPCKKYQEEKAANKKIAAALSAQVGFDSNQITLKAAGKKTLNEVAKVLNQYPWMAVNIQGHSSASAGSHCDRLVKGRADTTKTYLASKGCKNKMTVVKGTCTKVKAITIAAQDSISAGAVLPAGCKA
jgi:outer membrane protein OmpA-like peptidoglycan-associated protein